MVNPRRPEETVHEKNSLAKDAQMHTKSITETLKSSTQGRGYLSLAAGVALLLISLFYPSLLAWTVTLAALGLFLYGAKLTHLWEKAKDFFNYVKGQFNKFTKK